MDCRRHTPIVERFFLARPSARSHFFASHAAHSLATTSPLSLGAAPPCPTATTSAHGVRIPPSSVHLVRGRFAGMVKCARILSPVSRNPNRLAFAAPRGATLYFRILPRWSTSEPAGRFGHLVTCALIWRTVRSAPRPNVVRIRLAIESGTVALQPEHSPPRWEATLGFRVFPLIGPSCSPEIRLPVGSGIS